MSAPVFVADSGALSRGTVGATVQLDGPEARHAITVTRIRVGEHIDLVDGAGRRVSGAVAGVAASSLTVLVDSVSDEPRAAPWITVVQALPKGERAELAVELLTEIGVDEIVPWSAANCVAVWKGERADKAHRRWVDAARSAAKQSRRARFPIVAELASTADIATRIRAVAARPSGRAIVLHEAASTPFLPAMAGVASLLVVVGPEGGLTDAELATFAEAGAASVRLGPTVLRTSSAGMAAVAACLASTDRWSGTTTERA